MTFQKYDLDALTNSSSTQNPLVTYTQSVSQQLNYIPGILLILAIYFILFLSLKFRGYSTVSVFTVCNFINMIVCILVFAIGWIPGWMMVISVVLFPISMFMLFVMEG